MTENSLISSCKRISKLSNIQQCLSAGIFVFFFSLKLRETLLPSIVRTECSNDQCYGKRKTTAQVIMGISSVRTFVDAVVAAPVLPWWTPTMDGTMHPCRRRCGHTFVAMSSFSDLENRHRLYGIILCLF